MTGYLIEEDAGGARASTIDDDDMLPLDVTYYRRWPFSGEKALFWGRVNRVDHANDQAFIDIGMGTGVLPVRRAKHLAPKGTAPVAIKDCVHEGQHLLVQGVADAVLRDDKALTLTARPRLVGRYAIIEAGNAGTALRINGSKSLSPQRLKSLTERLNACGLDTVTIILRSALQSVDDDYVLNEIKALIAPLLENTLKPGLIWEEDPLTAALRDCPGDAARLMMDQTTFSKTQKTIHQTYPDLAALPVDHDTTEPLEALEEAIDDALADTIALPSGGSICIEVTRALTAVDVNMGKTEKGQSAAEAKRITNMEAALALAHHLRFQNIGGLIVVDFINMTGKGAAKELTDLLDAVLSSDHVPVQRGGLSQFGLMELSRGRSGLSLKDRLVRQGPQSLSPVEAVLRALTKAEKLGLSNQPGDIVLPLNTVEQRVLETSPALLDTLKAKTRRRVQIKSISGVSADQPYLSGAR